MPQTVPASMQSIYKDILDIKVQGATNVAIATIEALVQWTKSSNMKGTPLAQKIHHYGWALATARTNEPLAKNAIHFLDAGMAKIGKNKLEPKKLAKLGEEYLTLLTSGKEKLVNFGIHCPDIAKAEVLFTHCHSSTVEALLAKRHELKKLKVIHTETRPLFQGHITAQRLLKHGLHPTMIVDDGAAYFIKDDHIIAPIDVVLLGADQILPNGDTLNKVGSYGMALSAFFAQKPVYIVTPALKVDTTAQTVNPPIEMRPGQEVWPDAPQGLQIVNPSFDVINHRFIKGFITELGILDPRELVEVVRRAYPWLPAPK